MRCLKREKKLNFYSVKIQLKIINSIKKLINLHKKCLFSICFSLSLIIFCLFSCKKVEFCLKTRFRHLRLYYSLPSLHLRVPVQVIIGFNASLCACNGPALEFHWWYQWSSRSNRLKITAVWLIKMQNGWGQVKSDNMFMKK